MLTNIYVRFMCGRHLLINYVLKNKSLRNLSNKNIQAESPIEFSKTTAAKWKAEYSRHGPNFRESTWTEAISFTISLMAMVIYFGELRESNDLDEELEMPLGKRLFQMHLDTLYRQRNENIAKGLTTLAIDEEISDVERQKKKYNF